MSFNKVFKVPLLVEATPFTDKDIKSLLTEHRLYASQKSKSVASLDNKPGILCFCTCHPLKPFTGWVRLTDEVLLTTPLDIKKGKYATVS